MIVEIFRAQLLYIDGEQIYIPFGSSIAEIDLEGDEMRHNSYINTINYELRNIGLRAFRKDFIIEDINKEIQNAIKKEDKRQEEYKQRAQEEEKKRQISREKTQKKRDRLEAFLVGKGVEKTQLADYSIANLEKFKKFLENKNE